MTAAVALSEIVNSPDKFTSQMPYYVVAQLNWIQTRYLFISTKQSITTKADEKLTKVMKQDPSRTPVGPNRTSIVLPWTATSRSRQMNSSEYPSKKQRLTTEAVQSLPGNASGPTDDEVDTVDTLQEDLDFLCEDAGTAKKSVTSFVAAPVPNLKLLPPPTYATSTATKRIQNDLQALLMTQKARLHALHELGWYFHADQLLTAANLYQWIIEMHSFPLTLPLAMDMEKRNVRSIVLELCFHADYPNSPPFVRVVRPRLLQFKDGGGGHVTAGGSICMDLLTNSGWSAAYNIESVLVAIRAALMSSEPRYARLANLHGSMSGITDYSFTEAISAYQRVAIDHGWKIPPGVSQLAQWVHSG